jgi:hypothetical protein
VFDVMAEKFKEALKRRAFSTIGMFGRAGGRFGGLCGEQAVEGRFSFQQTSIPTRHCMALAISPWLERRFRAFLLGDSNVAEITNSVEPRARPPA